MIVTNGERLFVSTGLTGKMTGMTAITSSCKENPNCRRLSKIKGSICSKCYADRSLSMYKNAAIRYAINTEILSSPIPISELPIVSAKYCRLESHGDLVNTIHFENYVHLATKNPDTTFALWSKQYDIVYNYFLTNRKPDNLLLVLSSPMINRKINTRKFVSAGIPVKTFTVYDKGYTIDKGVVINCGAKSCIGCLQCYQPGGATINELLK